jgi:hypothetical protein
MFHWISRQMLSTVAWAAGLSIAVFGQTGCSSEVTADSDTQGDGQWVRIGEGLPGPVRGIGIIGGTLWACGSFTPEWGSVQGFVARFDEDGGWTPVGEVADLALIPFGIAEFHGDATVFGDGGDGNTAIETWSEGRWDPVGEPQYGFISGIEEVGSELLVVGAFGDGQGAVHHAARLIDDHWEEVGRLNGVVYAIWRWGDRVVIGGEFTHSGETALNCLGILDGQEWRPIGTGIGSESGSAVVYCGVEYKGTLIVGGRFSEAGGDRRANVAVWDGSIWNEIDGGIDGGVLCMTAKDDRLIVGGGFWVAGQAVVNRVATLVDGRWKALGAGFDGRVFDLAMDGDTIVAGGEFKWSADERVQYIASFAFPRE